MLVSYNSLYNRISQPRENLRWPMNFKWTTCAARKPSWDWCKLQLFLPFLFFSQSLHIALVFAIWQGFTLTIVEIRKMILSNTWQFLLAEISRVPEGLWNAWEVLGLPWWFLGVPGSSWEFLGVPGSSWEFFPTFSPLSLFSIFAHCLCTTLSICHLAGFHSHKCWNKKHNPKDAWEFLRAPGSS